jgi:hypothetical protein
MSPTWLHLLSIVSLTIGAICAVWIVIDEVRDQQNMWIMNLVWPITALYATMLGLAFYFTYGRLTTKRMTQAAEHAHKMPPSKRLTPFPIMAAKGTLHCGSGCTLGDILAEWLAFTVPIVAVWFGYQTLFSEKMFAIWVLDYIFAFVFGIAFQYFTIAPMRNLSVGDGLGGGAQGRYAFAHGLADRHVRIHDRRPVLFFPPPARAAARGEYARVLVHDADRHAHRIHHQLSGELVADQSRHQGADVTA